MKKCLSFQEFNELSKSNFKRQGSLLLGEESLERKAIALSQRSFSVILQKPIASRPGVMKIFHLFGNRKFTRSHLLWHALFKSITAEDWIVLEREFELHFRSDATFAQKALFAGVISSVGGSRERAPSWDSRLRSFRSQVTSKDLKDSDFTERRDTLMQFILKELNVPSKAENLNSIYSTSLKTIYYRIPKEERRIGVGYKDKGTLSTEPKIDPVAPEEFLPETDFDLKSYMRMFKELLNDSRLRIRKPT